MPFAPQELKEAEEEIVKFVQGQSFTDELKALCSKTTDTRMREKCKGGVNKASRIFKLGPVLEDGIMRVRGRLQKVPNPPTILPRKHYIVDLINDFYHKASGHSGVEYTLPLV